MYHLSYICAVHADTVWHLCIVRTLSHERVIQNTLAVCGCLPSFSSTAAPNMAGSYDAVYIEAHQGERAAFGEPLTCSFSILNQSGSPLPQQTLKIHPCSLESYWEPSFVQVPELSAHSSKQVQLKAFCRQTAHAEDIPAHLTVQLEPCGIQRTIRMRFWDFTGGLTKLSPAGLQGSLGVEKFNILLFGLAGAGKSSFINSVHTLLSSGTALILMCKWLLSAAPVRLQAVREEPVF